MMQACSPDSISESMRGHLEHLLQCKSENNFFARHTNTVFLPAIRAIKKLPSPSALTSSWNTSARLSRSTMLESPELILLFCPQSRLLQIGSMMPTSSRQRLNGKKPLPRFDVLFETSHLEIGS